NAADTSYVFTATLSNASHGDTTIVTDKGNIVIGDGQTTGTLVIEFGNAHDCNPDTCNLPMPFQCCSRGYFVNLVIDATASATANVNDATTVPTLSLHDALPI